MTDRHKGKHAGRLADEQTLLSVSRARTHNDRQADRQACRNAGTLLGQTHNKVESIVTVSNET